MIGILIILVIYAFSGFGAYKFIQKSHYDSKGQWFGIEPYSSDILLVLVPVLNSFIATMYCGGEWKHEKYRTTTFFKPKNKNNDNTK